MLHISKIDPTCPTIPRPVIISVTSPNNSPIIATRPFNCSENTVNPCGIFGGFGSVDIRKMAAPGRTDGADADLVVVVVLFTKEAVTTAEELRKASGEALTKVVFIFGK